MREDLGPLLGLQRLVLHQRCELAAVTCFLSGALEQLTRQLRRMLLSTEAAVCQRHKQPKPAGARTHPVDGTNVLSMTFTVTWPVTLESDSLLGRGTICKITDGVIFALPKS